MEYRIVEANSIKDLMTQVNALINPSSVNEKPWVPVGGVAVGSYVYSQFNPNVEQFENQTDLIYYQSLTR